MTVLQPNPEAQTVPPAERLTRILGGPEEVIPLTEAALLVASHRYPDLDVQSCLERIDAIGVGLRSQVDPDAAPTRRILALNQYLFGELGFGPNTDDYYDPRNSFLNDVLERRLGIPITLSLLYMEVGNRIDLPLQGVCFPGHFLVKCRLAEGMVVLDPYAGGISLGIPDLQRRLREVRGGEVSRAIIAAMLVAATKKNILLRMLRNLKAIYLRRQEADNALHIMQWIVAAAPTEAAEIRDRGMLYQELDCFRAAISDFERYLELAPDCADADDVRRRMIDLQRNAARLN
ncbi:MAG TPA: tetratricopeptide repeat protein [Burkholderiales bacterium]|nr:tetratricopeptide repeat protein [Burkholderiales bacterium]